MKIKRRARLIVVCGTDLIMALINRSNSAPLRPFDTVRAGHKTNSPVNRIIVASKETDESLTFDVPGLHIRKVGHWNFFAVFACTCVNASGSDFYCIYQFEFSDVIWLGAFVGIRRPRRTVGG